MADLASATAARQTAVGGNTLDNETRAWNRFSEYCKSIDSETTFSLKTCPKLTESKSLEVSPWLCVKDNFLDNVMLPWLKAQSQIPSTMWLWSSGKMGTTTQTGCRAQRCTIFTASTKIVQNGRSKRSTTNSSSRLCSSTHPFFKFHRTSSSNGQTRRSCPLLSVQVRNGT